MYNVPETVTGYWGVTVTAPIVKSKLNLSARYRQSTNESTQYNYVFAEPFTSGREKFGYTDQSLMVSLKWNF